MSIEPLKIVFQNENFVVLDKPALMLSVPSRLGQKEERPVAGQLLQQQLKQQIFPCHRLDYEVSGLLLFALNANAHAIANKWFERKKIKKIYYASSAGSPEGLEKFKDGELWTSKIVRGKKRSFEADHGDPAETYVRTLSFNPDPQTLHWKLEPITGRSHQLRFEMAKHGFPIDGDKLYGSLRPFDKGIALRASELHLNQVPPKELLGLPTFVKI